MLISILLRQCKRFIPAVTGVLLAFGITAAVATEVEDEENTPHAATTESTASATGTTETATSDTATADTTTTGTPTAGTVSPNTPSSLRNDAVVSTGDPNADTASTTDIHILDQSISPGTSRTLYWTPSSALDSLETPVPVQIVHGGNPGPTLCLTAAVHGDELNGIEIVRQIMQHLDADELNGTVIGVPIVNLDGFRRASRYVSDRRDLNRHFPGSRSGSLASRIGYSFFHNVITHCQYLVDVHTGSFHRTNLPQLRAHLKIPAIVEFTKGFGGIVVVQEKGEFGTLRRAAQDRGIVAVTLETGGPLHLEKDAVDWGVKGIENLLHSLDMQTTLRLWTTPQPVYYKTKWVRAEQGGLLFSEVELNDVVKKGQLMGRVTDPITNTSSDIIAPGNGRIVGMAFDQVVSPGFAAYHMGIEAPAKELSNPLPAEQTTAPMMEDNDIPAGNSQEDNVPDEAVDTHDPLVD